jgi:hypothetical protein
MPWLVAAAGALLCLPSLRRGLQSDDYLLVERLRQGTALTEFFSAAPAVVAQYKEQGVLAWWSGPLELHFLRPLAALTHRLDFALFGDAALPMRLQSVALYALLCALAALAYRELLRGDRALAGLCALLFAVDDAHGMSVGWISSRNTILGCLFALAALLLHARARTRQQPLLQLASAACVALALLSGEIGVTALALLGAYALVLDPAPLASRARSLLPHAAVALVWAAWYIAEGAGLRGSGWYRDARSEPLDVLVQGALDMPVWLFSQLGLSIASIGVAFPQTWTRVVAALLLLPIVPLLLPALRARRQARFFALAMLLAIVPLWTTVAQDRVLLGASFGGFGLIACSLQELAARADRYARVGRRALIAGHLVIAPLLFAPLADSLTATDNASRALAGALPARAGGDVVVVNLPLEMLTMYGRSVREREHPGSSPATLQQLYAGSSALIVRRIDARTLELEAEHGWGAAPTEQVFTTARHLRARARSGPQLRAMRVRVMATTPDGRPARVRFAFPSALESPERTWLCWSGSRPVPFRPPAIGEDVRLPALSLFSSMEP